MSLLTAGASSSPRRPPHAKPGPSTPSSSCRISSTSFAAARRSASRHMTQNDKVAIVTGAARGIGLAIAERLLADGYRVALLDIDRETLAETAERLRDSPILA